MDLTGYANDVAHKNGVPWHEAPLPRRWHKCSEQTVFYVGLFEKRARCACGAVWIHGGWTRKNERRTMP